MDNKKEEKIAGTIGTVGTAAGIGAAAVGAVTFGKWLRDIF